MFNRNAYFEQYFKQNLEQDETYHYFYLVQFASFTKYLIYQSAAPSFNKHAIVCITNKRILICQMDPVTGNLTGNASEVAIDEVKHLSFKKGFFKTKVTITFNDNTTIELSPRNSIIGLSNHKKNLLELMEIHS